MNKRKLLTQEQKDELIESIFTREYRHLQVIYLYGLRKEPNEIVQITQFTSLNYLKALVQIS
jgi:hypothetical protein